MQSNQILDSYVIHEIWLNIWYKDMNITSNMYESQIQLLTTTNNFVFQTAKLLLYEMLLRSRLIQNFVKNISRDVYQKFSRIFINIMLNKQYILPNWNNEYSWLAMGVQGTIGKDLDIWQIIKQKRSNQFKKNTGTVMGNTC